MIDETLGKIEERIRNNESVEEGRKSELLKLLGTLKAEVDDLSKTHREHAESIAGFTQLSAHEATREQKDPRLLQLSIDGLSTSVAGLEKTHPKLVGIVNSFCVTLSNLGI
jgi:hypothetical protein